MRYSTLQFLFMLITSWAIVCDITYLPPMQRSENESAVEFSDRVKSAIAKAGGFVDLPWDGEVKRMKSKDHWKQKHQARFAKTLKTEF